MSEIAHVQHLRQQLDEVDILVDEARESGDIVAKLNFQSLKESIASELKALEGLDSRVGEVALLFDGAPVRGRKSINAEFAATALRLFQDLVTRIFASRSPDGPPARRGKISGSELSALHLTGISTGSFGFTLEETEADQANLVRSRVREALEEATEVFEELTQPDEDNFLIEVDDINPRVFNSLTAFFKHLEKHGATMKAALPNKTHSFDKDKISRGHKRLSESEAKIETVRWVGKLVGLSPMNRTFEFEEAGRANIISGRFGAQISQDYLERIEGGDVVRLGGKFSALIEISTLRKPNGTISVTYTAIELEEHQP